MTGTSSRLTLSNPSLCWHLGWSDGTLRSEGFENRLTGHTFALDHVDELALTLSAATDRVQEPISRVEDFEMAALIEAADDGAAFLLRSASTSIEVILRYALDGPTRGTCGSPTSRVASWNRRQNTPATSPWSASRPRARPSSVSSPTSRPAVADGSESSRSTLPLASTTSGGLARR